MLFLFLPKLPRSRIASVDLSSLDLDSPRDVSCLPAATISPHIQSRRPLCIVTACPLFNHTWLLPSQHSPRIYFVFVSRKLPSPRFFLTFSSETRAPWLLCVLLRPLPPPADDDSLPVLSTLGSRDVCSCGEEARSSWSPLCSSKKPDFLGSGLGCERQVQQNRHHNDPSDFCCIFF